MAQDAAEAAALVARAAPLAAASAEQFIGVTEPLTQNASVQATDDYVLRDQEHLVGLCGSMEQRLSDLYEVQDKISKQLISNIEDDISQSGTSLEAKRPKFWPIVMAASFRKASMSLACLWLLASMSLSVGRFRSPNGCKQVLRSQLVQRLVHGDASFTEALNRFRQSVYEIQTNVLKGTKPVTVPLLRPPVPSQFGSDVAAEQRRLVSNLEAIFDQLRTHAVLVRDQLVAAERLGLVHHHVSWRRPR